MPLPFIIGAIVFGGLAGAATAKGAAAVRNAINEGESIRARCRRCSHEGPHPFVTVDRSWAGGAVLGVIGGAVFGTVAGVLAKRVFRCDRCGAAMYEDGERPSWNADAAVDAFLRYPELQELVDELQNIVARNQEVAQRHAAKIADLERQLEDVNADRERLIGLFRETLEKLRNDSGAAQANPVFDTGTLYVVHDGRLVQRHRLAFGDWTIGRNANCRIVLLGDDAISRDHALLRVSRGSAPLLMDAGSANGTYLNRVRLADRAAVAPGDLIAVGAFELRFAE